MARNRGRDPRRITSGVSRIGHALLDEPLPLLEAPSLPINAQVSNAVRSNLIEVEDRRTFQPERLISPARSPRRWNVRLVDGPKKNRKFFQKGADQAGSPQKLLLRNRVFMGGRYFAAPKYVAVCVRRKARREVLFAIGKGGGGKRRGRRNQFSNVRC